MPTDMKPNSKPSPSVVDESLAIHLARQRTDMAVERTDFALIRTGFTAFSFGAGLTQIIGRGVDVSGG